MSCVEYVCQRALWHMSYNSHVKGFAQNVDPNIYEKIYKWLNASLGVWMAKLGPISRKQNVMRK